MGRHNCLKIPQIRHKRHVDCKILVEIWLSTPEGECSILILVCQSRPVEKVKVLQRIAHVLVPAIHPPSSTVSVLPQKRT